MKNQILLNNLTPADVFYGHGQKILDERQAIKLNTLAMRRKMHYEVIADNGTRLPPKAVFGVAATEALGFELRPHHFRGG